MIDKVKLKQIMSQVSILIASKGGGKLKESELVEIAELAITIKELKQHGIDADNYGAKVKSYFTFREKALSIFGIELSRTFPFKNPTYLNVQVYKIMRNANLNNIQIKKLYKEFELNEPDIGTIENHTSTLCKMARAYIELTAEEMEQQIKEAQLLEEEDWYQQAISDIRDELQKEEEAYEIEQIKYKEKFKRILNNPIP